MKKEVFSFQSANGQRVLHGQRWLPEDAPRAVVQIAHGMAEYIGRYDDFATYLVGQGFAVFGHDHAGHGKSAKDEADKGFFYEEDGWRQTVQDLHQMRSEIDKQYPGVPVFLLGHSMGSFLSRWYVLDYGETLAGAIFVGTTGPNAIAGIGKVLARLERRRLGPKARSAMLDKLMFGSYNKAYPQARTAFDWLSTDEAVVDAYIDDPDCGFVFTTSAVIDLLTGIQGISKKDWAAKVPERLPVLLVAGAKDPVGQMGEGVRKVHDSLRAAGRDSTLRLYPEGRHEILNERNKDEVYAEISSWIVSKIQ